MTTSRQTIPDHWDATGRIVATEDIAVMITETEGSVILWALTQDAATPPDLFESDGHRVDALGQLPLVIKAGEVLWLNGQGASFDCTLTVGPA